LKGTGKTLFTSQLVITDKAKNPETIIRYFDFIYNPVNSIIVETGPLGIHYELIDGEMWEIENWKDKLTAEQRELYDTGNNWVGPLPKNQDGITINRPAGSPDSIAYQEAELRDQMYSPYLEEEMIPMLKYSTEDALRVADLQTAITEYVKQQEARWVTGLGSVDAEWDAYIAQLEKLGLPELLALKQAAYAIAKGE
jgi:putative aldouronate transport system substrate-binding protein